MFGEAYGIKEIKMKDFKYFAGGTIIGYVFIPSLKKFTETCNYNTTTDTWSYMEHEFINKELRLIDFPAFFKINKDGKWQREYDEKVVKRELEIDIENYTSKIESIEEFLNKIFR